MGKLIFLPTLLLLAAAAPAQAAPPTIAQTIAPSDGQEASNPAGGGKIAQPAQEKKICKNLDTSGTRLARRACLTESEWKKVQQELEQ